MPIIPPLDPFTIAGVNTTDGRGVVRQALLLAPLVVRVPAWDLPRAGEPPHTLRLFWRSHDGQRLLATRIVTAPPPAPEAFYEVRIELPDLRSATRIAEVWYTVETEGGSNSMVPSIPLLLDFDPPRLLRPTDVLRFVVPPVPAVNAQYLVANPQVRLYLPTYNIEAPFDQCEIAVSNSPNTPPGSASGRSLVDFSTTPRTVSLDAAAFRTLNDGPAYIFFRLFDETGNFMATWSIGLPFTVSLGTTIPTPVATLPAPQVQHTLTNGYLNCSSTPTVMTGVRWLIAAHSEIRVNDQVKCVWQGFDTNYWAQPNASVVFRQTLTWGAANITTGAIVNVDSFNQTLFPLRNFASATFTYEVWRGGVKVAESLSGRVRVDLNYSSKCYCTPLGIVCE